MQMNSPLSTFFEEKEEKNLATFFRFLTKNKLTHFPTGEGRWRWRRRRDPSPFNNFSIFWVVKFATFLNQLPRYYGT